MGVCECICRVGADDRALQRFVRLDGQSDDPSDEVRIVVPLTLTIERATYHICWSCAPSWEGINSLSEGPRSRDLQLPSHQAPPVKRATLELDMARYSRQPEKHFLLWGALWGYDDEEPASARRIFDHTVSPFWSRFRMCLAQCSYVNETTAD